MVKDWINWLAKEYVGVACIFDEEELESYRNEFKNYVKAHIKEMCRNCKGLMEVLNGKEKCVSKS